MSTSTRPLNRGAACLPCRKLKARCDGNRPACGRCVANNRPDDCEYAVGGEVTRSRLLEENIALLEARIHELENPGEAPSMRLHNPHRQESASGSASRTQVAGASHFQLHPPGMPQQTDPLRGPTEQPLTHAEAPALFQTFMAHAPQLGLFLNPNRFVRAVSLPRGAPGAVDEALMNAVYLWGSRLSSATALRAREEYFSAKAVQAASGATLMAQSMAPVNGVLHTVQAEVLLAHYFFSSGRFLEGKYHCLAAVALVTGSRLHQLDLAALAGAGVDPVFIGEKIHAFWTVYALDQAWSAAMNAPPSICQRGRNGIVITTPWPLAIEAYEQGIVIPRHGYNYSVLDFAQGGADDSGEEFSRLALRVKAAALLSSALYVSAQYRPDLSNRGQFFAQFTALDGLIENFHRQLAAIRNGRPDDMRELLVCRTLACVAAIQLHSVFAIHQPTSRQKSLTVAVASARALDIIDVNQYRHLDPVIAMLWAIICKTLVEEMRRLRHSAVAVRQEDMVRITTSLDGIMRAMASLAPGIPLMASHLAEIQQAKATMN
ncbi:hypothetical protein BV20DRAFT_964552 [Pilatotrama ljubarskyi]|nr:hypothetical protein BV20DRAFT_964552 [Pilatotrama ljubarskyi]